jgi:hypothetical protein
MKELTPTEILLRIHAAKDLAQSASDADASKYASLIPTLKEDGSLIPTGTRIRFGGKLYRTRVDLWDNADSTPEKLPSLWEEIQYRKGIRVIPKTITAEHPFRKGDRGWCGDSLYESILDGVNIYTPEQYPNGWKAVK